MNLKQPKEKSPSSQSKTTKNKVQTKEEPQNNTHKIRKKIEDILIEREEKRLWEL